MLEVDHPPALRLSLSAVRDKTSEQPHVCCDQVVIWLRFRYLKFTHRSAHGDISCTPSVYLPREDTIQAVAIVSEIFGAWRVYEIPRSGAM